ncbi:HAMP domain-containing protein, partial [Oscillibacter sp. UBA6647]
KLSRRLELLAGGDLHTEVPLVDSKDEVGILASSLHSVVEHLNGYIEEMGTALGEIADGQICIDLRQKYLGDFTSIKKSIQRISDSLRQTLTDINQSANQVDSGSRQISEVSQHLAQGSQKQAGSVENLSSTIAEISVT